MDNSPEIKFRAPVRLKAERCDVCQNTGTVHINDPTTPGGYDTPCPRKHEWAK